MRVFVTGATGFIGRATVKELTDHGIEVLALTRNPTHKFAESGVQTLPGDLSDLAALRKGAETTDGTIHLAFIHDFSDYAASCAADRAAIEAMSEAIEGTKKPLLVSGGTLSYPYGVLATENSKPGSESKSPLAERSKIEPVLEALIAKGINVQRIRFAASVHGAGEHALIPIIAGAWKKAGKVVYVDSGDARWPAVHVSDAASLLRLAVGKGKPGATYHAIAEEGVAMKAIGEVVAKRLGVSTGGQPLDEILQAFGPLAAVIAADNPTSSEITQKELGWQPNGPLLLEDLEKNYSF